MQLRSELLSLVHSWSKLDRLCSLLQRFQLSLRFLQLLELLQILLNLSIVSVCLCWGDLLGLAGLSYFDKVVRILILLLLLEVLLLE